jgi:uncharacterized membrane protein YfcA
MDIELLLVPACLVSSYVGSSLGFGGGMILAPVCFFILPPAQAVITIAVFSNLTNIVILTESREKHFRKDELVPLLLITIPGIILGVLLLRDLAAGPVLMLAGLAVLLGVVIRLVVVRYGSVDMEIPALAVYPVGLFNGVLAGCVALAPLAPVWMLLRGVNSSGIRDTLQAYYLTTGTILLIAVLIIIGPSRSLPSWWVFIVATAAIILGSHFGKLSFARLAAHEQGYVKLVMIVLALIGIITLARGIILTV